MKVRLGLFLHGTCAVSLCSFIGRADGWVWGSSCTRVSNHGNHQNVARDSKELISSRHRRDFLSRSSIITLVGFSVMFPALEACQAAAPFDAGEVIRRAGANIPGYGQTDVFFPSSLAGNWIMTRQVDFGNGREPLRLVYPFRFVRSIEGDAVVADRGRNQAELEKAVLQTVVGKDDVGSSVRSYEWTRNNPNDLRLVLADGTRKEIKTTKRATERTESTVSSSEFQRFTQEDQRGLPDVSARRVVTKWKLVDDDTWEGLEIIYSMAGGDPMAAIPTTSGSPTVLSKSRMILVRQ